MAEKDLNELFLDTLKDIYYAEKQILKTLPKMAKGASSEELRKALEEHLQVTQGHVQRLEQVFELLGMPAKGKTCAGMKGLLEEGDEVLGEDGNEELMDAAIIGAAQRVEHYEMAAYGTVRTPGIRLPFGSVMNTTSCCFDATRCRTMCRYCPGKFWWTNRYFTPRP